MSLTADAVEYHATGSPSAAQTRSDRTGARTRQASNSKETHR